VRAAGERVFEGADLGDGDAAGFGFRAEDKKIWVSLKIGIEKVGG
jgi:hypothetical protein